MNEHVRDQSASKPIRLLYILLGAEETSMPYNEIALPLANRLEVTLCTYFTSRLHVPNGITLFQGDGTVAGFVRALREAFDKRRYDLVHVHAPHLGALFLLTSPMHRSLKRTVYTFHSSYPNYKLRNRILLLPIFAFFRRVVVCSNASRASLPKLLRLLTGHRLRVVRNALDIRRVDRVLSANSNPMEGQDFTVIAVGRLVQIKNLAVALRAFQQASDRASKLVLVGDGPLNEALRQEGERLGLGEQLERTGLVSRETVYQRLAQADVYISTSKGEGLPVAVLEAMACRCPVILSDIPPHREIAGQVDFIPLVVPDDITGFAMEIQRFRQMSLTERAHIGEQCRRLVEERFSLSRMHAQYLALYEELIQRPVNGHAGQLDSIR